ncbi:endolytic transglycosylase MltG [Alloscardovia omnicolens]|uniref:endolytic transglycosylase MltG n=1 Tax=Alloscardovia omnicolens TaxID=419015 RepID=UPI003A638D10
MTNDNDLFDVFSKDAARDHVDSSRAAQLVSDMKIHEDAAAPPLPPQRRRDVRLARKQLRQKKRRKILALLLSILLLCGITYGGYKVVTVLRHVTHTSVQKESQNLDYPGPGTGSVVITIDEGDDTTKIAQKLVDADVIRSSGAFIKAVEVAQAANKLQAGSFELKKKMAAADVVTIITDPTKITGSLIVKPGERNSDVITAAAQLSGIDKSEFDRVMQDPNAGILPAAAQGNYEGWFEPGTYNTKGQKSAQEIISAMVSKRIAKLQKLGIPEDQYRTVLIKASIVDAEVNKSEYYGKVARVIENRLSINMPLGMDTIVAYGLGIRGVDLTNAQLNDSSNPYNARIHTGLPPSAINNPGDSAIQAVLNPEQGNWLYFVTVNLSTGETKFTNSESEFEQYVKEYKEWEANNPS